MDHRPADRDRLTALRASRPLLCSSTQPSPAPPPEAMPLETARCDVCNAELKRPQGYILTTSQVVSQPPYWRAYCRMHADELRDLGVNSHSEFAENLALQGQS